MKAYCASCPFRPGRHGEWQDPELAAKVIERTLFKARQICHGTEGPEREWNHRCKGAHDHNEEIYRRINLMKENEWNNSSSR
jgi:hypothetical protein